MVAEEVKGRKLVCLFFVVAHSLRMCYTELDGWKARGEQ
jgi:hypothetical protein